MTTVFYKHPTCNLEQFRNQLNNIIKFFFVFFFLTGIYNRRTYRQIRTGITVLTQITLITNYREATLYYKKYITNLNIMNGNIRKQG